jgi:hypothetical protein
MRAATSSAECCTGINTPYKSTVHEYVAKESLNAEVPY